MTPLAGHRPYAYYNEYDPFAAAWLRELIKEGHIADGAVDERSITEVAPADLAGFTQHHFFAGIGGWSLALRLAGWPDDRPIWTGSCPCQPFSVAGRNKGVDDSRHLWPVWFPLIRACRPGVVVGEQVEAAIAHGWLDLVRADLEGDDYAVGAVGLPAASVGAFHQRHRLWWIGDRVTVRGVADASHGNWRGGECRTEAGARTHGERGRRLASSCDARMAVTGREGRGEVRPLPQRSGAGSGAAGLEQRSQHGGAVDVADADGRDTEHRDLQRGGVDRLRAEDRRAAGHAGDAERAEGFWDAVEWLPCRDGKHRPVEPGTFPLAHGVPARVGRLRGYGNAIVPQVAAEVMIAYMEVQGIAQVWS